MKLFKKGWGWVFILAILFSACSQAGIVNTYVDNQGKKRPLNDSILQLAKKGYVQLDSSGDGNPLIQNVMLTIQPGFSDKYRLAKHDGSIKIFYIMLAVCIGLIAFAIWYGNDPGRLKALPIVLGFLAIIAFLIAVASIDRAHVKEQPITKRAYDSLLNTPDGLKPFWDANLFK